MNNTNEIIEKFIVESIFTKKLGKSQLKAELEEFLKSIKIEIR